MKQTITEAELLRLQQAKQDAVDAYQKVVDSILNSDIDVVDKSTYNIILHSWNEGGLYVLPIKDIKSIVFYSEGITKVNTEAKVYYVSDNYEAIKKAVETRQPEQFIYNMVVSKK
jgi:hypothetical protein